jgi:hypothetical protein
MNRLYCDKETEILEALRRGALRPELANHAASCPICADTLAVSQFPQVEGRPAPVLPDSDFLWWKAQLARKQMAVERATRSIALVRKVSYLGAAAAGLWLIFAPGHLGPILSILPRQDTWPSDLLAQSALLLSVGALVFTLLGSLYLARPEK